MPRFYHRDSATHQHQSHDFNEEERLERLSPKLGETGEIETLLRWVAPARPYHRKDRSYYTTLAIIAVLVILISLLAQEFLLIGVLAALTFLAYTLAFIPPEDARYKLSTQGVTIGDHFYFWHDLDSFWIKNKDDCMVLFIQTNVRFPAQLMLVLKPDQVEEVKRIAARFLPFHEIPHTSLFERWSESLQRQFPLENTHK